MYVKNTPQIQTAALCYKISSAKKIRILLITSRTTKRWIIPKGWPIRGHKNFKAAEAEAFEEAGATGKMLNFCVGKYSYIKSHEGKGISCLVYVYPLLVRKLLDEYPESHQRKRRWVEISKASGLITEPELKNIMYQFDPQAL